ncbi:elongation factor P [bacterium]|nr:elongation factor P [bacterium]
MAQTSDIRKGMVIKVEGELFTIVDFQHVKPGKGGGFTRTRLKNVKTGSVLERTYRSGEKIDDVRLERRPYQYLYGGDGEYVFMNNKTYEQVTGNDDVVGDAVEFLKEGMDVEVLFHGEAPLSVELPIFVNLEITRTDPGVRGDTASGGSKPATLETGAVVQVPLFIEEGEIVKIDTRTGEYVERVK